MAEPPADIAALVALARQGDDDALIRLVRQYEAEVRLVARVQLGPALRPYLDSFDLVQSVHKSLLRGLRQGKFDLATPQNLVALALAMVRNKVVSPNGSSACGRRAVRPPPASPVPGFFPRVFRNRLLARWNSSPATSALF